MAETGRVALVHYSAPPVIGGVEAVMAAHARLLLDKGYTVKVVAGVGAAEALPKGVELVLLPELSSQHPTTLALQSELDKGRIPVVFDPAVERMLHGLRGALAGTDWTIVHNVFTKHFNLALTAALARMLEDGALPGCLAWGHDFSWTSPSSREKLHSGLPWDLLRVPLPGARYVTVSESRRMELAGLFACPPEEISVVYNGVEPRAILGLGAESEALVRRYNLLDYYPVLLMPVRVTNAKNIEFALRVTHALRAKGHNPLTVVTGPPDPHDAHSMALYERLLSLRSQLRLEEHFRFVYESGPDPAQPFIIQGEVVGDLYRVSDMVFMPSLREGFGMPVVEAGLVGTPVACSTAVPAGAEIGGSDVLQFDLASGPEAVAEQVIAWLDAVPSARFKRRARALTWEAIFTRNIRPLLSLEN